MSARFTPPDNEAMVGPFAQCVRHPNATPLTYHGTNSWILAAPNDGACVVVDPAPTTPPASGASPRPALGAASPWPPWR